MPETSQHFDVLQPGVSDLGLAQIQLSQAIQLPQMHQASVADLGLTEV